MSAWTDDLLVELYRDGALSAAELRALAQRLESDLAFRQRFCAEARLQGTLAGLLGGGSDGTQLLGRIAQALAQEPFDEQSAAAPPGGRDSASGRARSRVGDRPQPAAARSRRRAPRLRWTGMRTAALIAAVVAVAIGAWWLHSMSAAAPLAPPAPTALQPLPPTSVAPIMATVVATAGRVHLGVGGARVGAPVYAGSRLETLPDGHADIRLTDGSTLTLAPGTALVIAQTPDSSAQVALDQGVVAAAAATQAPGRPLVFITADARATVVGTQLSLAITPTGSRLEVDQGRVRFASRTSPAAGELLIAAGEAGETRAGALLTQSLAAAPAPWAADLSQVIAPGAAEPSDAAIPWMTELWPARRLARTGGRLLVIWSGWGHPLGMASAECLADRHGSWADAGIQKLIADRCVPVAVDCWFLPKEADAIGAFYRSLVQQSGRTAGLTEGIYLCDSEGRLRGFCASGSEVAVVRAALASALERPLAPSTELLPEVVPFDRRYHPQPAPDDLLLLATARIVLGVEGQLRTAVAELGAVNGASSRETLWLARQRWQDLLIAEPRLGDRAAFPAATLLAIARGVLLDTTRGEQMPWEPQDLRASTVTLTVDGVTAEEVRLRIEGGLTLSDENRAYAPRLSGMVTIDRGAGRISSFDLLALGAWQQAGLDPPSPPGAQLGIHLTLAPHDAPVVHPHTAREGR